MRIAIPPAMVMLVLAQGCGANAILTSNPPPPSGGTLELLVSPPLHGAAAIQVTGPGGYNVSVTATETLGDTSAIANGKYTITAANVVVLGTTYVPIPASQTVLVIGNVRATVYYCTSPCPWSAKAAMPTARNYLAVGVVNGILYAVGGFSDGFTTALNTVEAYDPSSDSWTAKSPMPTARGGLAVGVVNGILYAVGGSTGLYQLTNVVEAYDPATDSWTTMAPMPTARYRFAMGEIDGILYTVGGVGAGGLENVLEACDPATNSWTVKAPVSWDKADLAAGVVKGRLYAVGGGNPPYASASVDAYDPSTDNWASKAPLPTARYDLAVGVLNGKVYAVGGETSFSGVLNAFLTSNVVESYDPAMNVWVKTQSMPSWRSELAVGVVGGSLYAIGGGSDPYQPSHAMEAYTP